MLYISGIEDGAFLVLCLPRWQSPYTNPRCPCRMLRTENFPARGNDVHSMADLHGRRIRQSKMGTCKLSTQSIPCDTVRLGAHPHLSPIFALVG